MKYPKLTKSDHDLRRHLISGKDGPRMSPRAAFDFVVGKALDRKTGGKK